ncbi:MAG: protease modulator HflK [Alteromonadaceae bacterium]|jgi:membrane protease subunit HflK|uniref:FtsH protease activity modulator HflK n=1 Tax=Pseudoalteromonas atlantica (strain T6c / ATCC BAA-1087) TaxID=3042615 RepID=UPI00005C6E87|nr:FtsH protease activity modulator HflK [Paraglaciecola sp. T6c]ABG42480.1 protease FtsH subunit HflK [Paraglaciecola sp. T6c]MAD15568.1 protease modulator HflK [Alteromonadaceae bacterium]MBB18424.1 protease modulator HflK [Rickettsiales bacterium]
MAWNEPGGNNNDPWKNRGGRDQGPPDLDEVFKNILNKFGKFGGGKGGSSDGKGFGLGLGLVVGLLVIVWFISGFYTIREAERGVVLRFGEFSHFVEPGLRWKPTFVDSVLPVDVQTVRSLPSSGSMLTEDENVVRVEMEVQYRILEPYKYSFSVTSPETSLSQAFDSAIRYVVGHSKMDDILTSGREVARQNVRDELQAILEPYDMGISIVDMNFKDARPPEEVKAAFDDAIAAQEDEQRFINEAEAYSREIEPRARGQVNRMAEEAQAYKEQSILQAQGEVARFEELLPQYKAAPEVTRSRIYLETLEEVYANTSKIMVDTKGSGNMLYLPLDKILEKQASSTSPSTNRRTLEGLRNQDPVSNSGSQDNGIRSGSSRSGRN